MKEFFFAMLVFPAAYSGVSYLNSYMKQHPNAFVDYAAHVAPDMPKDTSRANAASALVFREPPHSSEFTSKTLVPVSVQPPGTVGGSQYDCMQRERRQIDAQVADEMEQWKALHVDATEYVRAIKFSNLHAPLQEAAIHKCRTTAG